MPLAVLGASLLQVASARADESSHAGRVGAVDAEERTTWCTPALTAGSGTTPAQVSSKLQRIASDGTVEDAVVSVALTQRVRLTCRDAQGASVAVTSEPSRDADGDRVTATCPADKPLGTFASCMLQSPQREWYVYKGSDCGDGVAPQFDDPVFDVRLLGQMTGGFYELPLRPPLTHPVGRPLFNDTCGNLQSRDLNRSCASAAKPGGFVGGTDLGFSFLSGGKLHFGFGDTWPGEAVVTIQRPVSVQKRGSVLYRSDDRDPSNGIAFSDFDRTPESPLVAMEVIASPHDQKEISAINVAGFSVREAGHTYRFLWFATIGNWSAPESGDRATVGEGTLAWSVDGKLPFVRGDKQTEYDPPRWPGDSSFGAGTVWLDREGGWVYLFGVAPYFKNRPVHLARVRARVASILDRTAYRYWDGSGWSERMEDAAPLIPPGVSARPELTVAYSAYAGRWLMLLTPTLGSDAQLQLWQSPPLAPDAPWTPAGRWEKVATADGALPSNATAPGLYAPYTSDHLLGNGGRDVYFMLSQWERNDLVIFTQPYNVGLWSMSLRRRVRPGCAAE
ncbi:MAG: DUF4185 domain-containing protein [Polyangiales bacterium]